jgi:putative FmdB family regulatory protein
MTEAFRYNLSMPLYDFVCQECQNRFDVYLTYDQYGKKRVTCPACKSKNTRRRLPRVRVAKSDDSRIDDLAGDFSDPAALAGLEDDPQAMGRVMRKMGSQLGDELPPEFNEVVDRLEKGQSPEDIERDIPDLGGPPGDDL